MQDTQYSPSKIDHGAGLSIKSGDEQESGKTKTRRFTCHHGRQNLLYMVSTICSTIYFIPMASLRDLNAAYRDQFLPVRGKTPEMVALERRMNKLRLRTHLHELKVHLSSSIQHS